MEHPLRIVALALALALGACDRPSTTAPPAPGSAGASASAASPTAAPSRLSEILLAEHQRLPGGIPLADQQSREVAVRRAAARARARIGGDGARPGLLHALADEDDEVVAWAAYGLGFFCKGHEKETVTALAARALSRFGGAPPAGALDPVAAIARAVGKCGAEASEPTLVAWLAGPPAQATAAAFALGDLASARQKLREETLVALLNLAAGSAAAPPVPEALFPIGRLEKDKGLTPTVVDRLREVATARLATPGDARLFAVQALSRTGEAAAPELGRVLGSAGTFTAAERAEAARGLARLGAPGQRALAAALPALAPSSDPVALTGLVGEDFGVVLTAVEALADPGPAKKALADLAALPAPPDAPLSVARRVSLLRCAAAQLLAGRDYRDKLLAACDVTAPSAGIGARALVAVLGKDAIVGPRLAVYRDLVAKGDLRTREAALELLEAHDEIAGAAAILTEALGAKESGLASTAAEVIEKQPERATGDAAPAKRLTHRRHKAAKDRDKEPPQPGPAEALAPSPALVKALLDALGRPSVAEDPEAADALIGAAGALALKEARPRLDALCRSSYPTTREHAAKAIALVSGEKKTCDPPAEGGSAPAEIAHLARAPVIFALDTDAGALGLSLDPAFAPVAVTRVLDLARAGYYDGMVVHRVVPGFVAQFGAPFGDGFGGPEGKPALRCETSPLPFVPLAVGVALAGRDTGASQLFVMQGRYPHLDGGYALVGTATGPWAALAEGDVIRKMTVTGGP